MKFRCPSIVHNNISVLSLMLLAVGMPSNKVLMSIGAMLGVFNLILERDFQTYWSNIKQNKAFIWLCAFLGLHLLSLIWSSDLAYAAHDLKIKLPLLAIPLALLARPLPQNKIDVIYKLLIASLFFTSLYNLGSYFQWFGFKSYIDIREMSLFGSHIRYGILISLGAGLCLYLFQKSFYKSKIIYLIIFLWFAIYTFYSQVISGVIAFIIVVAFYSFKSAFSYSKVLSVFLSFTLIGLVIFLFQFFKPQDSIAIDPSKLPLTTAEGNPYSNDLLSNQTENNQPVYISVCEMELRREWNLRSTIQYDAIDLKNQVIKSTIIRYLTSKNLSKDAEGIKQLKTADIRNIEQGIASVDELKSGLIARLYAIRYQLNNNDDPNGHSLLQRFEYWKTAVEIIKGNLWIGVGVGDVQQSFDSQYIKNKTKLSIPNRLRAHNMYLTVFVSFGIAGLLIFGIFWFQFVKINCSKDTFFHVVFTFVILTTFLIEDTIETQLGVTIVSFFIATGIQNRTKLL